jgi:hypothetical protein
MQTANLEPMINIPPGTTRFGIEIGTVGEQAGLRPLWRDILTKHPALVAGLQARRMLAPDKKWQLIGGPFGSAAEATQVCDLFKKENFTRRRPSPATCFKGVRSGSETDIRADFVDLVENSQAGTLENCVR